jgi:hypothetical protein
MYIGICFYSYSYTHIYIYIYIYTYINVSTTTLISTDMETYLRREASHSNPSWPHCTGTYGYTCTYIYLYMYCCHMYIIMFYVYSKPLIQTLHGQTVQICTYMYMNMCMYIRKLYICSLHMYIHIDCYTAITMIFIIRCYHYLMDVNDRFYSVPQLTQTYAFTCNH